jgi:protocatechuate 3,4-dioxygenase beta subunit
MRRARWDVGAVVLVALAAVAGAVLFVLRSSFRGVESESAGFGSSPSAVGASGEDGEADGIALESAPVAQDGPEAKTTPRELPDGIWIRGRVVVPPGTPPDEHVEIAARVLTLDDGPGYAAAMGEDGRFAVMFPKDADSGWIEIHARYLLLAEDEAVDLDEPPEEVVLEPILGGCLRGRIVAASRSGREFRATTGTFVELSASASPESLTFPSRRKNVGQDLSFEFPALPPISGFELAMEAKDYLPFEKKLAIPPGTTTECEIALRPGARVSGRVVDAEGKPAAGALVWETETPPREEPRRADADALSGPDGSFTVTAIPPGDVSISFKADGSLREIVEVGRLEDGDVRDGLEIRLRSALVQGRVEWADGSPALDAMVELIPAVEGGDGREIPGLRPVLGEVHDGGRFTLEAPSEGPLSLFARSPAMSIRRSREPAPERAGIALREGVRPGPEPVVVVLESGLIARGRVIDDLGEPVREFTVGGVRVPQSRTSFYGDVCWGRFEDPEGGFTLSGLLPGSWRFTASIGNRTSVEIPPIDLPNESESIVLVLPRGVTLTGTVVDPEGVPVGGATVESFSGMVHSFDARRGAGRGQKTSTTDGTGGFELAGLTPGRITLFARSASAAWSETVRLSLPPGGAVAGVRLVLRRGGTIVCEVRDAEGRPEPGRRVAVHNPDGTESRSMEHPDEMSDGEGRLVIEDLPPGPYSLVKVPSRQETDGSRTRGPNLWTRFEASRTKVSVDVVAGEVTRTVLGGPRGSPLRVRGRVVEGGAPVAGIRVDSAEVPPSRTDAKGRFELVVPEPGDRQLVIGPMESGVEYWTCRRILEDSTEVFDLDLPQGMISGIVRDKDDRPVDGAVVRIAIGESAGSLNAWKVLGRTKTDSAGRFSFRGLPAGRGELTTVEEGNQGGLESRTEAFLGENAQIDEVVIRLP